ncbi:unnamed protein product (macronuclear) [Paramecium tetraurelia]|uniref:Mei2-like C-terminal RNA recognition motif domain-containing protein n=1 Tax=Paramecium tetraurelia TaxID=5888 RepID=A0DQM2_PARTE|nr:uncharacterized protein GSPATT00002739001 [Paramecium tetraurelia]CAK85339.1 unnamed protein product [Paramecium tetraurelia]|eukprot:XP_001452736.1 hypothetical protein (macronuclear) [Paramecium tetraurelia strain d4-2]
MKDKFIESYNPFITVQKFMRKMQFCCSLLQILSDDRTTLMLKNLPKYMRPSDLKNLLDIDFKYQFDFLYLPSDNNQEGNLGYAFVNFLYPQTVLQFFKKYNNNKWSINDKVDKDIYYKSKSAY